MDIKHVHAPTEFQCIEPDWKNAFHTLYGFCLGKGLSDDLKKCDELNGLFHAKWMMSKVVDENEMDL